MQKSASSRISRLARAFHRRSLAQVALKAAEFVVELVCDDQSARWRSQQGVPAEEYLERLPELTTPTEDALVLICREVAVRRELGDKPSLGEYQTRFPDLAEELALQFEVDRMLNNSLNGNAPTPIDAALIANTGLAPTFSASETEVDLAGFEFLEELGRGTSGIVYKAMQLSLRRFVAVKVLTSLRNRRKTLCPTMARSPDRGSFAPSEHRADLRSRFSRRPFVFDYGVRRRINTLRTYYESVVVAVARQPGSPPPWPQPSRPFMKPGSSTAISNRAMC